MVKFSKDLEAQLIPEWKDAFVNYWQLKKHVKKIKLSRKSPKQTQDPNGDFGLSIFNPIRFVVNKISNRLDNTGDKPEIIQVKSKVTEREDDEEVGEVYETELSQLFSEEDEVKVFFERLDEELNKVNQFYKTKESEFLGRGEILNKQLQTLLERKQILSDRCCKSMSPARIFPPSYSSSARNSDYSENPTEYNERPKELSQENSKMGMRVDIPATTPTWAISSVTSALREDIVLKNPKKEGQGDLITRKKTQCAEKMIRGAFVELYKGLGLLKTYSSLNMEAFIKILKKFDKVSNQQASASYLKVVKTLFISSDKVVRLMDEVESLFTKHFANNDRKQAMKFLRPKHHKESHMVTFFVGLFTGCFVTLFSVYGILAHLCGMFSPATESAYMETVYPVFSMFALLSLHLFMYGCNLFMWKSTRINCNFIFEFQHSTALKYRDAFLICTSLMTAVVAAMVIHLVLLSNGFLPCQVDAIPGILFLSFITLLICPLNIFYRPTRYCFLRVIRNIVCSPFYKVLMVDFFMADHIAEAYGVHSLLLYCWKFQDTQISDVQVRKTIQRTRVYHLFCAILLACHAVCKKMVR
ncbi:Phosphate transporter like [Actinidia chinensis var. chinensis]|uniref:Phosphate transporter like n=1 Tax=Actinidia chinensis var. chinensis TaxID=1590841 RepID=A0A2R6QZ99_ACTCC|nr:Phosphate transporter like [Actinidia chinensis var. chinensis]